MNSHSIHHIKHKLPLQSTSVFNAKFWRYELRTYNSLLTWISKPNHVKHMAVFLKSLQYSTFSTGVFFLFCYFGNNSPAFYNFRVYPVGLGEARGAKCGTGESVPLIKAGWKKKAKVIHLSSKTDTIRDALWTEIHSTLPAYKTRRLQNIIIGNRLDWFTKLIIWINKLLHCDVVRLINQMDAKIVLKKQVFYFESNINYKIEWELTHCMLVFAPVGLNIDAFGYSWKRKDFRSP